MTIKTKLTVDAVEADDYINLVVKRTMGDSNASSTFNCSIPSPAGRHKTTFSVGEEVIITADEDAVPTTEIFTGILEKVHFKGKGINQQVMLSGRDYSLRLQDLTVEPIVFTDTEISSIVTTILSNNNVPDITTNNVDATTTTLKRIAFNQESIFDALKQLAELSGFIFYVDVDKDLHFERRKSVDSGVSLDNTNIISSNFDGSRQGMFNRVWVYGDRYFSGFKEQIDADGSAEYILKHRPHNTLIEVLGSSLKGGVQNITALGTSGADYLVDFFNKTIDFQSGTDIGYDAIPTSGGSFIALYDRELPVVKFGQDDTSIKLFGPKNLIVRDESIKDPNTALDILRSKLKESTLRNRINCSLKGWFTFNPGDIVEVVLGDFDLSDDEISIIEIKYTFDKSRIQSEKVIDVVLSKKFMDITDSLLEMKKRIAALESVNISDSDVLTRLLISDEDFIIVGSVWNIYTTGIGSSFILGHSINGLIGSYATHTLGDWRGAVTLVASGGNDYSVTGSYNPDASEEDGFGKFS